MLMAMKFPLERYPRDQEDDALTERERCVNLSPVSEYGMGTIFGDFKYISSDEVADGSGCGYGFGQTKKRDRDEPVEYIGFNELGPQSYLNITFTFDNMILGLLKSI